MKDDHNSDSRRRFIKGVMISAAALQVAAVSRRSTAAELPRLDESEPSAKALGYVHDAGTVESATRGGSDRVCATCRFYTEPAEAWGPCTLFPGKSVAAKGWCKGWVALA